MDDRYVNARRWPKRFFAVRDALVDIFRKCDELDKQTAGRGLRLVGVEHGKIALIEARVAKFKNSVPIDVQEDALKAALQIVDGEKGE